MKNVFEQYIKTQLEAKEAAIKDALLSINVSSQSDNINSIFSRSTDLLILETQINVLRDVLSVYTGTK